MVPISYSEEFCRPTIKDFWDNFPGTLVFLSSTGFATTRWLVRDKTYLLKVYNK